MKVIASYLESVRVFLEELLRIGKGYLRLPAPVYVSSTHIRDALGVDSWPLRPLPTEKYSDITKMLINASYDGIKEALSYPSAARLIGCLLAYKEWARPGEIFTFLLGEVIAHIYGLRFPLHIWAAFLSRLPEALHDLFELLKISTEVRREILTRPEDYSVTKLVEELEANDLPHVAELVRRFLRTSYRMYSQVMDIVIRRDDSASLLLGMGVAALREVANLVVLKHILRYVRTAIRTGLTSKIMKRINSLVDLGYRILYEGGLWFSFNISRLM